MTDDMFIFPQYVFVYGTLMKEQGNNSLLCQAHYAGEAETLHSIYKMYDVGCPITTLVNEGGSKVKGELYIVQPQHMPALDRLESHPTWYKRHRIPLSDGTLAWCYLQGEDQHEPYWEEIIPDDGVVSFDGYRTNDIPPL